MSVSFGEEEQGDEESEEEEEKSNEDMDENEEDLEEDPAGGPAGRVSRGRGKMAAKPASSHSGGPVRRGGRAGGAVRRGGALRCADPEKDELMVVADKFRTQNASAPSRKHLRVSWAPTAEAGAPTAAAEEAVADREVAEEAPAHEGSAGHRSRRSRGRGRRGRGRNHGQAGPVRAEGEADNWDMAAEEGP